MPWNLELLDGGDPEKRSEGYAVKVSHESRHIEKKHSWLPFCLRWHLVFIPKMNNSRAGSDVRGSIGTLSIESQLGRLTIQSANDDVRQETNLVEGSSEEQFQNVIGRRVFKKSAVLMYEGVVESHDNSSEIFKVVYTNGHWEEMKLDELMKYLVPHEQPVHPYPNELPNKNDGNSKGSAQITRRRRSRKPVRTRKLSSLTQVNEGADNVCPPRQAAQENEGAGNICPTRQAAQVNEGADTECPTRQAAQVNEGADTECPPRQAAQVNKGADNICPPRQAAQVNKGADNICPPRQAAQVNEGADNVYPPRQAGTKRLQHSARNYEASEMMKLSARIDKTSGTMELRHSVWNGETSGRVELQRSSRKDETSGKIELHRSTRKSETARKMELRSSTRKSEIPGIVKLRRSTRKRKLITYNLCEESMDEDEYEDDEPDYPLPPIIQVPWAYKVEEDSEGVATKGRHTLRDGRKSGRAKRHWVSLRICASSYPSNGRKVAPGDESEG